MPEQEEQSRGVRTGIRGPVNNSRIYSAGGDINIFEQRDQTLDAFWLGRPASLGNYFVGREDE